MGIVIWKIAEGQWDFPINDAIPPTVGSTLQKSAIPPTVPWPKGWPDRHTWTRAFGARPL